MSKRDRWIILGGGASGLAAAFFLRKYDIDSEIVEKQNTIGGRMGTVMLGDRSLDCGGKNIGKRYKLFRDFAMALGPHEFEHFGLNSSQARDGRLVTFDAKHRWRTMLGLARKTSPQDMMRFGSLLWRVKSNEENGYLGSGYSRRVAMRYDSLPVSRYFSPAFCRRIIRPMSVRMNGAEPDEIYPGNLCSNIRMVLDTYEQFKHGLAPVFDDFLSRYQVRLNTSAESLVVKNGRVTSVRVRYPNGTSEELACAGVVLATPAPISAALVEPILSNLGRHLRSVAYYPVMLVLAEYDRPIFSPSVRALVFDEHELISNAGAYGMNDLHLVRYTFSGKTARRYLSASTDTEELVGLGEAALNRYIPVSSRDRRRFVAKRFDLGLCAYTAFHGSFLDGMTQDLQKTQGLYVTGDYIQGASIEACFRSAKECVERLAVAENGGGR